MWRRVISLRVYGFSQRRLSCNITVKSIAQKHSGSRLVENEAFFIQSWDGFNEMTKRKRFIKYALIFYGQQQLIYRISVAFTTFQIKSVKSRKENTAYIFLSLSHNRHLLLKKRGRLFAIGTSTSDCTILTNAHNTSLAARTVPAFRTCRNAL